MEQARLASNSSLIRKKRALGLGCSVGWSRFELAGEFDFAIGLDFSVRFIRTACRMQEKGVMRYELRTFLQSC